MNRRKDVFIDLGTAYITLYEGGSVLTRQLNVGIFSSRKGKLELLSYGNATVGAKITEDVEKITPVVDGVLVNSEAESLIIKRLFSDIHTKSLFEATRVYVVISCGLTALEKDEVEKVFNKIGYRDVVMIESVLSVLPYADYKDSLVAIYGAGSLEVGVVGENGIISACSLNIGGNVISDKISDYILSKYNVKVAKASIEHLKTSTLSLTKDDMTTAEVWGRDIIDGKNKSIVLKSEMFRLTLEDIYAKTVDAIQSLLTTIPINILPTVKARGLYLFGGGAEMRGLQDFLESKLAMKVNSVGDKRLTVIKGIAKLIEDNKYNF